MAIKFNANVNIQGQVEIGVTNKLILTNTGLTASRTFSVPNYDGALATLAGAEALTNKTIDISLNTLTGVAPLASPTFTGTVSGITATMVGLGNVTNESKATMFTSPTFTGTTSGITATMVGLGNVTNVAQLPISYLDTDITLAANSDVKVASQKATKSYIDTAVSAVATHTQNTDTGTTQTTWIVNSGSATNKLTFTTAGLSANRSVAAEKIVEIDTTQTLTNKTLTSPKINEDVVLTSTATNIDSAVTLKHTQHTDTGTTQTSFAIKSADSTNGVLLLASAGTLQIRNIANSAFANIRCNDFTVDGTHTYLNTNEVFVKDTYMQVNASITDNSANADAGLEVKRLDSELGTGRAIQSITVSTNTIVLETGHGIVGGDYIQIAGATTSTNNGYYKVASVATNNVVIDATYQTLATDQAGVAGTVAKAVNAAISWSESNSQWTAGYAGTQHFLARKYLFTNGAASTTWTITHNLGVQEVMVQAFGTDNVMIMPDSITLDSTTQCTLTWAFVQDGIAIIVG